MEISVTQFKARCLGIVEEVQREKRRVVISRHGRPAAVLTPIEAENSEPFFGRAADSTQILGDLTSTGEEWDAGR